MNMDEQQSDPEIARVAALAGELHVLIGKLKRRLRAEANAGDLTWSQTAVLVRLERDGPATVTTLARAEGVRPQSMGATIAVLEAAGLVRGAPDPADGRQTILSLTDTCRDMIAAGRAAREDWLSRAIQTKLSVAELEQLATGIELLKRLVD
jgi:DNA-binding MarR family transcriptional regulator